MRIRMRDIKCGDHFWECSHQGNVEFEAMSDATIKGDTIQVQGRNVETNEPEVFGMSVLRPWTSPDLYDAPAYILNKVSE